MKKLLFSIYIFTSITLADDYGFSLDELESIETKSYEYNGYIRGDYKYLDLGESEHQDYYLGELFFNYKHFIDDFTFNIDIMADYEKTAEISDREFTLNQAFINYKHNENHYINIGKITPKWGKGYYFNPVGFIDRKKDPNEPQLAREGFSALNYMYNKVYNSDLQNLTFDIFYIRTTEDINEYLYVGDSNIVAAKLYILYKDIDIDLIYSYSDKDENKIGIDLSTNIETNFEIHGEYGSFEYGYYSYLLGLKYLTDSELTILSEYFFQNTLQAKNTPFWDERYFINSFTQKEPYEFLYFNIYYKNILNINDHSYQNKIGFVYTGIKNLELDLSLLKNIGDELSEFDSKKVKQFVWLSLKYSF